MATPLSVSSFPAWTRPSDYPSFTFLAAVQETSLHYALKDYYAAAGAVKESAVDGYWIDVRSGDLLIEIQTRNFTALKDKLPDLLQRHPLRLVHPIPREKWIVKLPAQGETPLSRRRSPRRGQAVDVFYELVRIPALLAHPNFSLEILLIQEEEVRRADGQGSWRRKGVSIVDRRLLGVVDRLLLETPADLLAFLPPDLPQPFSNQDLTLALHIPRRLAGKMTYCLRALGVITLCGKRSKAHLFAIAARPEPC
jgi:hypothetical protein